MTTHDDALREAEGRTIWVDVDDTLVLWDDERNGIPSGPGAGWHFNMSLVNALDAHLHTHPNDRLVIWSGGGVGYAQRFVLDLLERVPFVHGDAILPCRAKDVRGPRAGDVVVDDMAFAPYHGCEVMTWQAFVRRGM